MEVLELRRGLRFEADYLDLLLAEAARRGTLELQAGGRLRLAGHAPALDPAARDLRGRVLAAIDEGAYQPPTPAELAAALGIAEARVREVVASLVDDGSLWDFTKGLFLSAEQGPRPGGLDRGELPAPRAPRAAPAARPSWRRRASS